MKNRVRTRVVCFLALAAIGLLSPVQFRSALAKKDTPPATVVRVTPPAPVFDDAKRLAESRRFVPRSKSTKGSACALKMIW